MQEGSNHRYVSMQACRKQAARVQAIITKCRQHGVQACSEQAVPSAGSMECRMECVGQWGVQQYELQAGDNRL